MTDYMVERRLPGFTAEHLRAAAGRARSTTELMTREGTPIRYLRSTYLPGEEKCFCLFQAPSEEDVREANRRAELPVERVVEVLQVAADDLR